MIDPPHPLLAAFGQYDSVPVAIRRSSCLNVAGVISEAAATTST